MEKKIKKIITVPLCDQWKDTKNRKWAGKTCAICSLKMVLSCQSEKIADLPVMDLVNFGLSLDGFIDKIGWRHKSLVEIAGRYGVKMDFQKKFLYTPEEKEKGLKFINRNIAKEKPVMVSILNQKKNGGHMVVINGFVVKKEEVVGYYILDPNSKNSRNKNKYFLDKRKFLTSWRGGILWLS